MEAQIYDRATLFLSVGSVESVGKGRQAKKGFSLKTHNSRKNS